MCPDNDRVGNSERKDTERRAIKQVLTSLKYIAVRVVRVNILNLEKTHCLCNPQVDSLYLGLLLTSSGTPSASTLPALSMVTCSASSKATSRSCSITRRMTSRGRAFRMAVMVIRSSGVRPQVGSSNKRSFGFCARARSYNAILRPSVAAQCVSCPRLSRRSPGPLRMKQGRGR